MASLLSSLIGKPYLGLQPIAAGLQYSASHAVLQLDASDATAANTSWPLLNLKNDFSGVGVGGTVQWQGQNLTPAFVTSAQITAQLTSQVIGAEVSKLLFSALIGGALKVVGLRGDLLAFAPTTTADYALGAVGQRWKAAYLGDGTVSGDLIPDTASLALIVGTATAHAVTVKTNGTVRMTIASTGQVSIGVAPDNTVLQLVSGAHPGNATTLRGRSTTITFPSTTTVAASANYAAPASAAVAFVLPDLHAFYAVDPVKGAGSTITNYYGFRADSTGLVAGTSYGFYANVTAVSYHGPNAEAYSFYSPAVAPSYHAGFLLVGSATMLGFPYNAQVYVWNTDASSSGAGWFKRTVTPVGVAALTADVLSATTPDAVYAFQCRGAAAATLFSVRGDGAVFVGTNLLLPANNALVTIDGRLSLTGNQVHDLVGNSVAATIVINSAITVQNVLTNEEISLRSDVTLVGTGQLIGVSTVLNGVATAAASLLRGASFIAQNAGAGATQGCSSHAQATVGHTGALVGIRVRTTSQAGTASAYGIQLEAVGKMNRGLFITAPAPGDQLDYGIYIDSSVLVNTAAFVYGQRATATAAFLQYFDSAAALRFQVDVSGNVLIGGLTRRISADMDNAAIANRLCFVTSSVNQSTTVTVIPSGNATTAALAAYNANNPDAASLISISVTAAKARLNTGNTGGTTLPLEIQVDTVAAITIPINRDVMIGPVGAVTGMAVGFPYIPAAGGAPTGVPTVRAGYVPMYFDTTNSKIWCYTGAVWKGVVVV